MKNTTASVSRRRSLACLAVLAALSVHVSGQTIPNPSFESDTFGTFPGYISGNTAITGWTGTPVERVGLNPAAGSPFADNGTIPDGNNVAFIQANVDDPLTPSTLSTTISGLTVGTTYKVAFRANARTADLANKPNIKVYIDGIGVLCPGGPDGLSTAPVGSSNPYWTVAFEFQAAATSQVLSIVNDAEGDQTLLVDDFRIAPTNGRLSYAAWTSDADADVDSSFFFTHAYSFGSSAAATINGVTFTGVDGGNPAVAGQFSTTILGNVIGADHQNNLYFVGDGSSVLATRFIYGGNVPAGLYQAVTIMGLTPGTEYVANLYTVAWEDPSVGSRWATFTAGTDALTINQDAFYNNNGLRISYRYTADATGTIALKFAPLVPANVSIHIYGFSNREANPRDVLPVIGLQPRGVTVSPDLSATFTVAASGVPTPTYQWRFNGANIDGATEPTYTVPVASSATAGTYDVVVSNRAGSVTSDPAQLVVGIPMVNPSFEIDTFPTWPGYVSGNWPITGWTSEGGHGVNPTEPHANGVNPFADNGVVPDGTHVAFMQADGPLHQTVSGLTPGAQYYVHYYENARTVTTVPGLEVQVAGATVVPAHVAPPVRSGGYRSIASETFTAAGAEAELSFIKSSPQLGDCTALVDSVAVVPVPAGTAPAIGMQPQAATVYVGEAVSFLALGHGSLPVTYQWKLNGTDIPGANSSTLTIDKTRLADEGDYTLTASNAAGSATSAPARLTFLEHITTLHSTGLDANNQQIPAGAVDPFWTFLHNPDGGSPNTIVGKDVWPIDGTWTLNSATSKWIGPRATLGDADIAGGDYTVRTTFDLTGRDINTVSITGGWMSDNNGVAVWVNGKTVNVPLSGAFNAWTAFTLTSADVSFLPGVNTIDFAWNNASAGPAGVRVEFTRTSARTLPGIKPAIAANPIGGEAVEGGSFTMNVVASGTLPLEYQWRKDGVDLPGKTEDTLTLVNLQTADSGKYSVKVSNQWGDAISTDADLCVCLRPIPGIFGTGVDATGALLPDGAVDPHFVLTYSADPIYPGPEALVITNAWPIQAGVWVVNGPDSRWISARTDQRSDITPDISGNYAGDYIFRTTFDLTGYDLSKVRIVGQWAVDNAGVDIALNDVSTGQVNNGGFAVWTSFTLDQGLVAGLNTVDFTVNNAVDATYVGNPMGLRVDLKGYLEIQVAAKPTLTVAQAAGTLTVAWSPTDAAQQLQSAPAITGPWTKIDGATSPYSAPTSATAQFFRVVTP